MSTGRKRALMAIPPVVLLVALLWFGFGRNPSVVTSPMVGKTAPDFSLPTQSGKRIQLSRFRGHPTVVMFFAHWCTSCRQGEPGVVQVFNRWKKTVRFIGIDYEESVSAGTQLTRANGGTWPDVQGNEQIAVNFGLFGVPATYFINRNGVITGDTGSLLPADLDQGIRQAVRSTLN